MTFIGVGARAAATTPAGRSIAASPSRRVRCGREGARPHRPPAPELRLSRRRAGRRCSSGSSGSLARPRASGFDSLFVMDHLHQIPGVGAQPERMLEGNTVLAALAARTERLNLGLMVGGVTYREPGAPREDHDDARRHLRRPGDPLARRRLVRGRAPRLRLRLPAAEGALRAARGRAPHLPGDVHGGAARRSRARTTGWTARYNNPRPIRGDIPILVGGSGERKTLRLVAQYADACNVFGDPDRIRAT